MSDSVVFARRPHLDKLVSIASQEFPVGPVAFADGESRIVIALPSVWTKAGVTSKFGVEKFVTGVFVHEMVHTKQTALIHEALGPLQASGLLPSEVSDGLIQQVFESDPEYRAAIAYERDLLLRAIGTADDREALNLVAMALEAMDDRRARWFVGEKASYAVLEDVSLSSEGLGQLAMYRYLSSGLYEDDQASALEEVRDGGADWMQDEGFSILLLADRFLGDLDSRMFREPDWRARALLMAITDQRKD